MCKQKYYTKEELIKGIDGLPKFTNIILRNARQRNDIKYTKVGRSCVYRRDWILDYLKQGEKK